MGCSCVQKSSLCEPTAVLVSMAVCTAQLRASLFPYSQMKWPSCSLRYSTENTMDGREKPCQPHKSHLLCTTQALSVVPPPFEINPVIDFISLFNSWLLLTVGPVMFRRISIQWRLFSIALLQVMALSWEKSQVWENRPYFMPSQPNTTFLPKF